MSHLDNITKNIPLIRQMKILDLGSGKGNFMIEAALAGCDIVGLEKNTNYIETALTKGQERGLKLNIITGVAENIPFPDNSFDFINVAEVIEHVNDPIKTLKEIHRVLKKGGEAYISVPARFSIKDPHYNLYFINWLPRVIAEMIIKILGRAKGDSTEAGLQKLSAMHYFTCNKIINIFNTLGFTVRDTRRKKISERFGVNSLGKLCDLAYMATKDICYGALHFMIRKR